MKTEWSWIDAFPYWAGSELDRMDKARAGDMALCLPYCQFLCGLIHLVRVAWPPIRSDVRLLFRCNDVITDCVSAELLVKLLGLLDARKREAMQKCRSLTVSKIQALDEAAELNEIVGCCRFAKEYNATPALPQLLDAYTNLERVLSQVRVMQLYMLARTTLASAELDLSNEAVVCEASSYATAFNSVWEAMSITDREGLIEPVDVRLVWIAAHRCYGGHLVTKGRFRAAKSIYSRLTELDTDQLAMDRMLSLDLETWLRVCPTLPCFDKGSPLKVGVSPLESKVHRVIFEQQHVKPIN